MMKKFALLFVALIGLTSFSFAQKYAFVDTDYILKNMPEYRVAQEQLDELALNWQKEIEKKFEEIDKLYKTFQAEAVLLPEDLKEKRRNEIIEKERTAKALQKQRFGKEGDLYKKRVELIKPIQDKVYNAIEMLAKQGNYAVIFDKAGSLTMLYTNPKFDLSDDILKKMGYTGSN